VQQVIEMKNALQSPVIPGLIAEQLRAFDQIEAEGMELLGSSIHIQPVPRHSRQPTWRSRLMMWCIWSGHGRGAGGRLFRIKDQVAVEVARAFLRNLRGPSVLLTSRAAIRVI
jgi:hypothetical protein